MAADKKVLTFGEWMEAKKNGNKKPYDEAKELAKIDKESNSFISDLLANGTKKKIATELSDILVPGGIGAYNDGSYYRQNPGHRQGVAVRSDVITDFNGKNVIVSPVYSRSPNSLDATSTSELKRPVRNAPTYDSLDDYENYIPPSDAQIAPVGNGEIVVTNKPAGTAAVVQKTISSDPGYKDGYRIDQRDAGAIQKIAQLVNAKKVATAPKRRGQAVHEALMGLNAGSYGSNDEYGITY